MLAVESVDDTCLLVAILAHVLAVARAEGIPEPPDSAGRR